MATHCDQTTLVERLARIETVQANVAEKVEEILVQVRTTNGRVNAHDRWIERHQTASEAQDCTVEKMGALVQTHERLVNKAQGAWWMALLLSSITGGAVSFGIHLLTSFGRK